MMALLDRLLNPVTMYRLVLYYAAALIAVALAGGIAGLGPQDPARLCLSIVVLIASCEIPNRLFARLLKVPANRESGLITALILVLLMPPVASGDLMGLAGLAVAGASAIASKYLLTFRRKHIFNPVAFGAVVAGYLLNQPATWWVDSDPLMLIVVVAGGVMILRKLHRFDLFAAYGASYLVFTLATTPQEMWGQSLQFSVLYAPLLFAGFAMLTEPLTAPQGRGARRIYGAIVGVVSSPNAHLGGFYFTPELALLLGNLFTLGVQPHGRFRLVLKRIEEVAEGCYDYVFAPDRPLPFVAGQYLDWTMDVPAPDDRGNRRTFTIASAPGDQEVRLGVKFYPGPSAYKRRMAELRTGAVIYGTQIGGSFTLPGGREEKLCFIAGGIGITPFRSMIRHMLDTGDHRSVVLLYGNRRAAEIAYADLLEAAEVEMGMKTVFALAEPEPGLTPDHHGFIDEALIRQSVPDFAERIFYISGPQAMVAHFRRELARLGVPRRRIRTDYFPGFA